MSPPRRAALATTGRPEHVHLESNVRQSLDAFHADLLALDAADVAYTPGSAASWVAPLPATVQEALDRIAAAGGVVPVP